MTQIETEPTWLGGAKMTPDSLDTARRTVAIQRAQNHLIMLMLAALAKTAPPEVVDHLFNEIERVRDLSGPAGYAAGDVFAVAASTLERFSRRD